MLSAGCPKPYKLKPACVLCMQICKSVIRAFPGFDSKIENGIEKATDSWLPGGWSYHTTVSV